ncbi:diacylglycerol acyltransferase [Diaporthe helianthi]|uniref:diacylglycerol O-acyltransferase n=1 Tax=Diaporthe helianthi TaxID=158607 RepID=A0A2P5IBP1_DIAHE|nr:diacylglycerol acyltransferase [Diaporthe helianthi]
MSVPADRDPGPGPPYVEPEMDDSMHSSASISSPTHPAFFKASPRVANAGRLGTPSPGKENVCPSPMAAAYSPLGSTLVMHLAGKKSPQRPADNAGAVLNKFIHDCTSRSPRGGAHRRGLGDIDTSNTAAQPANDVAPAADSNSSKKSKRKSKKTNGVKEKGKVDAGDQPTSQPASYAEAVKEDPSDITNGGHGEENNGQDSHQGTNVGQAEADGSLAGDDASGSESKGTREKDGDNKDEQPTAAGSLTFAEAVKEGSTDATTTDGDVIDHATAKSTSVEKRSASAASSQGSTAVDYPDIPSDAEGHGEEAERLRDQEKAPEVAGLRWAPLRVPFKRRLQTLAVLFHCLSIGITLSIFFGFCAIPLLWPLLIIYLVSILFATDAVDGKLRRRKEWVRRLPMWKYFAEYYPAKLHKTHELVPTRKYIFGYHPHGIISHGAWAAFATDALGFSDKFPGITNSLLTLDSNFRLPLYREYVFSMGVLSVSKESITNILTRGGRNGEGMGRAVTIVVGGARESLEAQPHTARLIINERKGFVKLAIRTGADLVPVMAFGENDLYDQLDPHKHPWLHGLQRHVLKVWKFTVPLLHGRGIFNYDVGMMPYRRPLNIVVGRPIKVVQAENPDNAEVDRLHEQYVEELRAVWDRYKDEFARDRIEEMEFLS